MTNQNNAAQAAMQSVLTEEDRRQLLVRANYPRIQEDPRAYLVKITEELVLSKLRADGVQAGDERDIERERQYAENTDFRVWWDEKQACPEHSLITENAAHAAWQERGRRAALASAPEADSTLPFEQALYELVNKIDPGLDTGDLLQDAQRASAALGVIMASAPVASAEVMDALNWVDDFIARCNRDDRGSCDSVNVLRRALAAPPKALHMRKRYAP